MKVSTLPLSLKLAARIETLPAGVWIGVQALALWPTWQWAIARMTDGSDDPLGVMAAGLIALALRRWRHQMRLAPHSGWLTAALLGTLATTAAYAFAPPLACAVLAALSLTCGIAAFLPQRVAVLPFAGLSLLALPILSSLQFYAGFPLRLVTAEVSKWLLKLFDVAAERSGAAMLVDGHLIIVDAPCSGVQMVWMAYCTACAMALFGGLTSAQFFKRLPLAGAAVLAGNVLRNTFLVAQEAQVLRWSQADAGWVHDVAGLVVLGLVCGFVCVIMKGRRHAH
jgi:exosortase/archaeosortase family protein